MSESSAKNDTANIVIALALVLVADAWLSSLIDSPLRLISSTIAALILNSSGLNIVQEGVMLVSENFRYEVVDACNGSSSLSVMLGIGVFWALSRRNLNILGKALCILLATVIALLSNGLRVTALVAISHSSGVPVTEGFLHFLIGLTGFVIAAGLFLWSSSYIGRSDKFKTAQKFPTALLLLPPLLVYLPFILRCLNTWTTWSYGGADRIGWMFTIGGSLLLWRELKASASSSRNESLGSCLFSLAMMIAASALLLQINLLLGVSLLVSLLAESIRRGLRLRPVMLLFVIALGFPSTSIPMSNLLGLENSLSVIFVKVIICGACLFIYNYFKTPHVTQSAELPKNYVLPTGALFVLALMVYSSSLTTQATDPAPLDYVVGKWAGKDKTLTAYELSYFGEANIVSRVYRKDGKKVHALITYSGSDRNRNHPPEYCLTGSGWQVKSRLTKKIQHPDQTVSLLKLRKDDTELDFYYWFMKGDIVYPNYTSMMLADTVARLSGENPKWRVFRVFSPANPEINEAFILAVLKYHQQSMSDNADVR